MTGLAAALAGFAALDAAALGRPWEFAGARMDVRYALYRTLEDAQDVAARLDAAAVPESRRILALADRAFGDLRGLLVGLPLPLLAAAPAADEWPVRETLRHVLLVERRYAAQTRYAVDRGDDEPVRIAEAGLPTADAIDGLEEVDAILDRLGAVRAETNLMLGALAPAAMTRPTVWVSYRVDVRFRLHRFAAHLIEHTIQCEKTLEALGWRPTEGRRIVRRVSAAVAELEGLGAVDEAREIARRLVERLALLGDTT